MKKLLLSLLCTLPVMAQSSFHTEKENLVWEKVFPIENANVASILENQPTMKIEDTMDNVYRGVGYNMLNSCTEGSAIMKNPCKFEFMVVVNPDNYIVRVKEIKIIEKYGPMQITTKANRCENYFVYKTKIKADANSQNNMSCLDSYLSEVFTAKSGGASGKALTSN